MSENQEMHEMEAQSGHISPELNFAIHALKYVNDRRRFPSFLRWLKIEGCLTDENAHTPAEMREFSEYAYQKMIFFAQQSALVEAQLRQAFADVLAEDAEAEADAEGRSPYL